MRDPRYTSEASIFVSPPDETGDPSVPSYQVLCGSAGILCIVIGASLGNVGTYIFIGLGIFAIALAIFVNALLVTGSHNKEEHLWHSVSIVNTLIGYHFSGLAWIFVIGTNLILVSTSVFSWIISAELDAAWGCYSGALPISRLTAGRCRPNFIPELCWDVTEGRGVAVSCPGVRHAGLGYFEWIPILILVLEWTLITVWKFRGHWKIEINP